MPFSYYISLHSGYNDRGRTQLCQNINTPNRGCIRPRYIHHHAELISYSYLIKNISPVEDQLEKMKEVVQCAMDAARDPVAREGCFTKIRAVFTSKCKLTNIERVLNLITAPNAKIPIQ